MELTINSLVAWRNKQDRKTRPRIERVLWLSQDGKHYLGIFLEDETQHLPHRRAVTEFKQAIAGGDACEEKREPYHYFLRPDDQLASNHKEHRDRSWAIIQPIVDLPDHGCFFKKMRGPLVVKMARQFGVTEKQIRNLLECFWKRGMTKNALLPDWKSKKPDEIDSDGKEDPKEKPVGKKRGKMSRAERRRGKKSDLVITPLVKAKILMGLAKFAGRWLTKIFDLTRTHYFCIRWENGQPIMPPDDQLPTWNQFYRVINAYRKANPEKWAREWAGERLFNLTQRAAIGISRAFGPGAVYQIDATLADIYLVSWYNRTKTIGRPVVYLVVDVFSHLIVGVYIGLENPSYLTAGMALYSAFTDKEVYCQRYGVKFSPREWPSNGVPQKIYADGGELKGLQATNIANLLNVEVTNAPPYRADLKGLVERSFKAINDTLDIRFIPGGVAKERTRGERDPRCDAILNLSEFRTLILDAILYHNRTAMRHYPLVDEDMIADGVSPIPWVLWEWGIQNRTGLLQTRPEASLRLCLLPKQRGSITRQGILFKGMRYTCRKAIEDGWFIRAGNGRIPLEVSYDPRYPGTIYVPGAEKGAFEECFLTEDFSSFGARTWEDIEFKQEEQKDHVDELQENTSQCKADLLTKSEAMVKKARAEKKAALDGLDHKPSKASQNKSIRDNRQVERGGERQNSDWNSMVPAGEPGPGKIIPMHPGMTPPSDTDAPDSEFDLIDRLSEENDR